MGSLQGSPQSECQSSHKGREDWSRGPIKNLREVRQTPQGMVDNWPTVADHRTLSGRQLSPAFRGADAGTCQEGLDNLTGEMTGGPENGTKVREKKRRHGILSRTKEEAEGAKEGQSTDVELDLTQEPGREGNQH